MISPFPGMDPYLEAQGRWRDLHASLITYSRDALNEVLSENYVAQIDEQIRLVSPDAVVGVLYPDVLVGLDLLLGGRRLPMKRPMPPGDYYALVARAERRPDCGVYPLSVREPLPSIPIPLRAPDPDVWLHLAEVVALAYERGRYGRTIDYNRPLDLPLQAEDKAWAEHIARAAFERASP